MKFSKIWVGLSLCILSACTSYIWNPPTKAALEASWNNKIGKNFSSAYPWATEKDIMLKTPSHTEYIFDRYDECAWIVRVNNNSNTIESWRYLKSCNLR